MSEGSTESVFNEPAPVEATEPTPAEVEATEPPAEAATETDPEVAPVVHEDGSVSPAPATAYPAQALATDAQGVDRIVSPYHDPGWEPAPVSATDEQKAHAEAVLAREEEARQERLDLLNAQNPTTGPAEPVAAEEA